LKLKTKTYRSTNSNLMKSRVSRNKNFKIC